MGNIQVSISYIDQGSLERPCCNQILGKKASQTQQIYIILRFSCLKILHWQKISQKWSKIAKIGKYNILKVHNTLAI